VGSGRGEGRREREAQITYSSPRPKNTYDYSLHGVPRTGIIKDVELFDPNLDFDEVCKERW
jgi:hypothetical protein